jgi:outer membrane biosynthesis protein TonB
MIHAIRLKYNNLDRDKRIYVISLLLSLLLHVAFLLIFIKDIVIIDLSPEETDLPPEEVTVLFPENKPKSIVENINENNEVPEESDFLSDFNSKSRTEQLLEKIGNQPMSEGNIPFANLTRPNIQQQIQKQFQTKKFSRDALIGKQSNEFQDNPYQQESEQSQERMQANQSTTNNVYNQKEFSADQMGDISLSTYAWEWAPYINALKRKLYTVWFTPAAYHRLGLIHGQTVVEFSISREGKLLYYKVHDHQGHESLEKSSVNAITAVFPFKKLPDHFPEENLTITARLIYPKLR